MDDVSPDTVDVHVDFAVLSTEWVSSITLPMRPRLISRVTAMRRIKPIAVGVLLFVFVLIIAVIQNDAGYGISLVAWSSVGS